MDMVRNCSTGHIEFINVNALGGRYKDRQTDTYTYCTQKQFQETSHTPAYDWHVPGLKTQQNDFLKSGMHMHSYR